MYQHCLDMVGCADCAFLEACGGTTQQSLYGCFWHCRSTCANPETCDLTCPRNPRLFASRMGEIGGSFTYTDEPFRVPSLRFPAYLTKIHNGCARAEELSEPLVALPARELMRKRGDNVRGEFKTPTDLRAAFHLSRRTRFIITCIGQDEDVETVWQGLYYGQLAREFARLRPAAVITPNFSFFPEVPRTHTVYNRKRICMAAQLLSRAGCPVILPVYALTAHDWLFWLDVLRANPLMSTIALEFQTGLAEHRPAREYLYHLGELQRRVGRPLHLVGLGARPFAAQISAQIASHTVLDSRPFMMTHKRRRLVRSTHTAWSEVVHRTARGEPVDRLLKNNIREHRARIGQIQP